MLLEWAGPGTRRGSAGRRCRCGVVLGQAPAAETVICPASILPGVSDHGFWAVQSLVTEPGPAAAAIDQLPSDLGALRAASRQLVFHYWADGDYAANGIAPERISEIDTRYAAAMFARLGELLRRASPRRAGLARLEPESRVRVSGRDAGIALRYGWGEVTRLAWLTRPGYQVGFSAGSHRRSRPGNGNGR
jgi:hypothetical protein